MAGKPIPQLPVLPTDCPLQDPYDNDYVGGQYVSSVHPTGTRFGAVTTLPRNFGRSTLEEANTGWAGGLVGLTFPLNYASNESLMVMAHKRYAGLPDLARGWQPLDGIYMNVGDPTFGSPVSASIGSQDKGEYVYVGLNTQTGFGGYITSIMWRFNRLEFAEVRYAFSGYGGPSMYFPAPVDMQMFVTDTSPPRLFFYDNYGLTWHMLDNGVSVGADYYYVTGGYNDWGDYSGTPLEVHNVYSGQYGATRWQLPVTEPYRPDRVYVPVGSQGGSPAGDYSSTPWVTTSGLQFFRSWTAPTEWPELWLVIPKYKNPTPAAPNWTGAFDIYRVPNVDAGSTAAPTRPGWDDNWQSHHYSTLDQLPGVFPNTLYGLSTLTFRFHKDHKQKNVIWITAVGSNQPSVWPSYKDDYNNCWYAKSLDDGKTWGRWQQGALAHGANMTAVTTSGGVKYDWTTVGDVGYETYRVPISNPVLTYTNDLVMPISYSEYHGIGNPTSTRPATLYTMAYEGVGGGKATQAPAIFKRGELNRATWL